MAFRELLVEGSDDFHVIAALLVAHAVPQKFGFKPPKDGLGVEALLDSIPVRLKINELECLAVVLDADWDVAARWQQIRARLEQAGCSTVPDRPIPGGMVLELPPRRRVGVWVMPNNELPGMLEDFVGRLIPSDDSMLPHVDGFLATLPESQRLFSIETHPKARVHAWLAVQREPGKPMGQAITARYFNPHHPVARTLLEWLRRAVLDDTAPESVAVS